VGGVLLSIADQALQLSVLADGELFGRRIAPFDPPLFSAGQEAALERIREQVRTGQPTAELLGFDAELGWSHAPSSGSGDFSFDRIGARIGLAPLPEAKQAGIARVGVFGCSFAIGVQVAPRESWPAVLDAAGDNWEVSNLGVAGYGLDQAFLRWRRVAEQLDADEVWLAFLPAAALRNLSMYRPALRHWSETLAFKPRFVLDAAGRLELVPNPARSFRELERLVDDQDEFLRRLSPHDAWVRRFPAAYAPRGSHWSHASACARLILTELERGGRDFRTRLADSEDEVFRIASAVVIQMAGEVAARGARFRLLILPDRPALREHGASPDFWSALVAQLEARSIEVVDLTEPLLQAGAHEADSFWTADGHYAAPAHRVVGTALGESLRR
jgi:hypothetical protein